jgi:DinB superfamily
MSNATPKTTADVLSRVDRAWASLEGTVGRLSPTQLTELRDPAGWAVKDDLMHVAAWEDAFVARLEGRPTHEALGLDEATLALDEDAVNAAIFERHRDRALTEVLDALQASHRTARARLAALHDRTVAGPASGVLPSSSIASTGFSWDSAPGSERDTTPAGAWIGGNTWEHYDAHHGWIRELVARG